MPSSNFDKREEETDSKELSGELVDDAEPGIFLLLEGEENIPYGRRGYERGVRKR